MKLKMGILLLATMITPTWVMAADLFVATNGSDSNPGTLSAPFKTISAAATKASPGTTVHVAQGIYNGNIRTNPSGTASARIRYISDSKWGAKIIGTGTEFHWDNRGSYVDIIGFDVSGSGRVGILNMGSYTVMANNHVHDLKISGGCTGNGGAGINNANYLATDGDIIGNVVHDIGVTGKCNTVQGIYHSILRGRISNNIVYRASAIGISLWHAANETTIVNNTVFANDSGIVVGRGDTGTGVMTNTRIANNIVYKNTRYGIAQYCYSGEKCIGSGNTVVNNLVYGNGSSVVLLAGSATGTITADPQFVNYQADGSGNYRLKSTSPAVDKGSIDFAPTTDIVGVRRPQGSGIDLGAFELENVDAPVPAPAPAPAPTPAPAPAPSSGPALTLSVDKILPGATFYVNVTGAGKSVNEWVALYLASNPDSTYSYKQNWMTMNGTKTNPPSPIASATLKFIAPMEVGTYNIRLFANDGYANRIAISANFSVAANVPAPTPAPAPAPTPEPTPTPAPASLYHLYVATTGSDSNAGTLSAPVKTILRASQLAKPGTTIHVAKGVYAGGFKTATSGTETNRIRYVSDEKWGAKIVGSGGGYIWHNYGNYVTVDGFDLSGAGKTHGLISGPSTTGDFGHHFTATNNYVHDMSVDICGSGGAITGFSLTGHSTITNNIIRNIGASMLGKCATEQGIYISDPDSYIANNVISGVAAVGIHQWHGATRSTILNNTVFNCLWGILLGSGDSGMLPNGSQNNYVANNIVYKNTKFGYMEYGKTSYNTYRNNLTFGSPADIMNATGNSVSGTIKADPLFVNYQPNGTGNYHLQSNSPAVNKALPTLAPANDINGVNRSLGGGMDLGAYESY